MEFTKLSKNEEEILMKSMLDFVLRVASDNTNKYPEEVDILPDIIKLLLQNFKHKTKSSDTWSVTPLVDADGEVVSPLAKIMIRQLQHQQ